MNTGLIFNDFYRASAVLAMGLCVTSRCSVETAERIELVLGV